jgi:hypothetical protein
VEGQESIPESEIPSADHVLFFNQKRRGFRRLVWFTDARENHFSGRRVYKSPVTHARSKGEKITRHPASNCHFHISKLYKPKRHRVWISRAYLPNVCDWHRKKEDGRPFFLTICHSSFIFVDQPSQVNESTSNTHRGKKNYNKMFPSWVSLNGWASERLDFTEATAGGSVGTLLTFRGGCAREKRREFTTDDAHATGVCTRKRGGCRQLLLGMAGCSRHRRVVHRRPPEPTPMFIANNSTCAVSTPAVATHTQEQKFLGIIFFFFK